MPTGRPDAAEFTIRDYSSLNARLLWCYEDVVVADNRRKFEKDRHIHAWCLLRGAVTVVSGGRKWVAQSGEWMLGSPQPYRQDFTDDARIISVNFKVEWPSGDSLINDPVVVRDADFPMLARVARPMAAFIRRHFPGVKNDLWLCPSTLRSYFEIQGHFSRWLVAYLQVIEAAGVTPTRIAGLDARVVEMLRYLDRHAWSAQYHEAGISETIGVSVRHLDRLFVQQIGRTPREYLQKRRFESAVIFLSESTKSIKRIGYDLGFSSPGHFTHWFQQKSGQSPSAFRSSRKMKAIPRLLARKAK
ncbi:MAG: AraC family transcriptional regulator [Rariglobus sp.]|jgi:AraC-like DNA-binding protein|nr:AraC family transcriptional regulator [Rariglobus sp.]